MVDVREAHLDPERQQDDPAHHRQVQHAVGIARHLHARETLGLAELSLRDERDDVEVGPPQRGGDHNPEQRLDDDLGVELRRADADRHDRLPQSDDDEEPVPLGEVAGGDPPAAHVGEHYASDVDRDRHAPQQPPSCAGAHQARGEQDQRQAVDRLLHPDIGRAAREQDDVQRPDHEIRAGEKDGVPGECTGDGQGRDQQRRHRGEHGEPVDVLVRVDGVRQPGVRGPRPPQDDEHEETVAEPSPRRIVRHEARDLGDREDEHEVEEELK